MPLANETTTLKFADYCKLEPELARLYSEAKTAGFGMKRYCAMRAWYGEFKQRMLPLVGYERERGPRDLQTSEAYEYCYFALLEALPRCYGARCGCER